MFIDRHNNHPVGGRVGFQLAWHTWQITEKFSGRLRFEEIPSFNRMLFFQATTYLAWSDFGWELQSSSHERNGSTGGFAIELLCPSRRSCPCGNNRKCLKDLERLVNEFWVYLSQLTEFWKLPEKIPWGCPPFPGFQSPPGLLPFFW